MNIVYLPIEERVDTPTRQAEFYQLLKDAEHCVLVSQRIAMTVDVSWICREGLSHSFQIVRKYPGDDEVIYDNGFQSYSSLSEAWDCLWEVPYEEIIRK